VPTLKQLETALINADRAGDEDAARALAAEIKRVRAQQAQPQQPPPSRTQSFLSGIGEAIPRAIGGIIEFLDPEGRKLLTPEQKAAYERQYQPQREANPNFFTAGQITGETVATAPLVSGGGQLLAKGGQKLAQVAPKLGRGANVAKRTGRVLEQGGKAISSGGVGVRPVTKAAVKRGAPVAASKTGRAVLRAGGGAGAGAATAALTDQDIDTAAATGAVIPIVGSMARNGIGWTYDLLAKRLGETKAADILRNIIADNPAQIANALRNAPKNVKANTAEFLAERGLLTPEFAAATRIVSGSKASKLLEQSAKARAEAQDEMRAFIRGGETQTAAVGGIASAKQAVRAATAPMREENLMLADIGRTQIIPAERNAMRLRDAASAEVERARRFMGAADNQAMALGQMDDLGDAFNAAAINRQRGVVGGLEQRAGQAADKSLQYGAEARAAEEVAANLRAQGLQPLDIGSVVGNLRRAADEAEFVNPARFRVLSEFANNLERRAAKFGGVIDATGLYELRKNMGSVISDLLGPTDPKTLQAYTAQIIGETQPLIDDAIKAAGGRGWTDYLDAFSQGMKKVERQQFERELTKLPEARYAKVMAGDDPDFVKDFFGPGRFDINVELMGPKLPTAHSLAKQIEATRAVAQTGLEDLTPSQRLSLPGGARSRVMEALEPGVPNVFMRGLSRIAGGAPRIYGGGAMAEQLEREYANKLAETVLKRLAPALASPTEASRLLGVRPTADTLGGITAQIPPGATNAMTQYLRELLTRPSYSPNQ